MGTVEVDLVVAAAVIAFAAGAAATAVVPQDAPVEEVEDMCTVLNTESQVQMMLDRSHFLLLLVEEHCSRRDYIELEEH